MTQTLIESVSEVVVPSAARPDRATSAKRWLRRGSFAAAMWFYGLSITFLLVGLWGKAVAADGAAVARATSEVAGAALVSDRVVEWVVASAGAEVAGAPDEVEPALRAVLADPEAHALVSTLVADVVEAALAPPGEVVTFDPSARVAAALPEVRAIASRLGEPEAAAAVEEAAAGLEPIRLDTGPAEAVADGLAATRRVLTIATVAAAAAALALGAAAAGLSFDRRLTVRQLAMRPALTGLALALMGRLGSWALDPASGGAEAGPSFRRGVAAVLGSSLQVPLLVGIGGAVIWFAAARRRRVRIGTDGA